MYRLSTQSPRFFTDIPPLHSWQKRRNWQRTASYSLRPLKHFQHGNIINIHDVFHMPAEKPDAERQKKNDALGYKAPLLDICMRNSPAGGMREVGTDVRIV